MRNGLFYFALFKGLICTIALSLAGYASLQYLQQGNQPKDSVLLQFGHYFGASNANDQTQMLIMVGVMILLNLLIIWLASRIPAKHWLIVLLGFLMVAVDYFIFQLPVTNLLLLLDEVFVIFTLGWWISRGVKKVKDNHGIRKNNI